MSTEAKVNPIPAGYHTITPYLVVADAQKEIEFLQKAFGAELTYSHKGPDGSISHAEMKIGTSMLMISQARGPWQPKPMNFYLYVEDCDAWYRRAVAAGAESTMAPANMYYGDRHGGVRDVHGNGWWIGTHIEDVAPEEIERRAAAAGR